MGDDLSRGLLIFGEGKELGKTGLRWLKIHLSNLYGYDKASFDERERFADEHIEEIYDSALRPLDVCIPLSVRVLYSLLTVVPRGSNGGSVPTTPGNASRLASNFTVLWNLLILRSIFLISRYTKMGLAMDYNIMLPLEVTSVVLNRYAPSTSLIHVVAAMLTLFEPRS